MQRIKEITELESIAISRCRKILEKNRISRTEEKVLSDTIQLIQTVNDPFFNYPRAFEDDEKTTSDLQVIKKACEEALHLQTQPHQNLLIVRI